MIPIMLTAFEHKIGAFSLCAERVRTVKLDTMASGAMTVGYTGDDQLSVRDWHLLLMFCVRIFLFPLVLSLDNIGDNLIGKLSPAR